MYPCMLRQFSIHCEHRINYRLFAPQQGRFLPRLGPASAGPFSCQSLRAKMGQKFNRFYVLAMHWSKELAYTITPKSGPMRRMATLLDANRAISEDLPPGFSKRHQWFSAGMLLVRASITGSDPDILRATEAMLKAIDSEDWMSRGASTQVLLRSPPR